MSQYSTATPWRLLSWLFILWIHPLYASSCCFRCCGCCWIDSAQTLRGGDSSSLSLILRAGAQPGNDDDDEEEEDPTTRTIGQRRASSSRRRRPPKPKSTLSNLAQTSFSLTSQVVSITAKQSSQLAYHLLRPKHVTPHELVGLWRLDQVLDNNQESVLLVEITVHHVRIDRQQHKYRFVPSQWGRSAYIEFEATTPRTTTSANHNHNLFYRGYIHRKLADPSVLKIKGTIYAMEKTGWRGKGMRHVPVGTFVARRRMKLDDEEEEDGEDTEVEEEEEGGEEGPSEYDNEVS